MTRFNDYMEREKRRILKVLIVWSLTLAASGYGYVMNAINVLNNTGGTLDTGLSSAQFIGLFVAPLGVILGYMY